MGWGKGSVNFFPRRTDLTGIKVMMYELEERKPEALVMSLVINRGISTSNENGRAVKFYPQGTMSISEI